MVFSETMLSVFEIIGTVAFAVSGAVEGIRHKMDIFGVTILGVLTAVGGGVIRDLVIGRTPPIAFVDPTWALLAVGTSLLTFLVVAILHARRAKEEAGQRALLNERDRGRLETVWEIIFLLCDTLGLATFTMLGIRSVTALGDERNVWLLIFVGVITGVGGGVMRDLLACTVPAIFRKHVYALAAIAGAIVQILTESLVGQTLSMLFGFILIVALRLLAAAFRWNLPKIRE